MATSIVRHDYNGLVIPRQTEDGSVNLTFDLMLSALNGDSTPFAVPATLDGLTFVEDSRGISAMRNGRVVHFSPTQENISQSQIIEEVWMDDLAESIRAEYELPHRVYTPSGWLPYDYLACPLPQPQVRLSERPVDLNHPLGAAQIPVSEWGFDAADVSLYLAKFSKRKSTAGFLYVIGADQGESVKVGYSADPCKRLKKIQSVNPDDLHIVFKIKSDNAKALEAFVHKKLSRHCVHGEWFERKSTMKHLPRILKEWDSTSV
jgi:hypothetical protein